VLALTLVAGCTGRQSALDPRGPVAEAIAGLWWVLFWGALGILVLVMGAVFYAMFRHPDRRAPLPHIPFLIGGGLVLPIVVLTVLLIYGTQIGRLITQPAEDPLLIEVTGHQWWWEVRYPARGDMPELVTANELRLPVGTPVEFVIRSVDVVHSFWIPNLGGKVDMIPGRTNTLRVTAGEAGRFRGQCSEFCGAEHSRMGFVAIAESAAEFDAWRRARSATTTVTEGPGLRTFMDRRCGECHTIAGTAANGTGGPVLTKLAARPTLGASTIPNTAETLRLWLADHGRQLKPGGLGPRQRDLEPDAVEAIAAFLEDLQ